MITSSSNKKIKEVQNLIKKSKARRESKKFVAEGVRIVEETPLNLLEEIFIAESFYNKLVVDSNNAENNVANYNLSVKNKSDTNKENLDSGDSNDNIRTKELRESSLSEILYRVKYEIVSDKIMKELSDTVTTQGILSVVNQPHYEKNFNKENGLYLVLETLQDPGNLGTIFRTAEGAGVHGILMNKTTVDLFSPKVVRATMGSIYRMPFWISEDLENDINLMKKSGVKTYAAHLAGKNNYDKEDYLGSTAFLIGNEGNGLSDNIASLADCYIKIPMGGKLESLNAAMATGILVYEAARQRRNN